MKIRKLSKKEAAAIAAKFKAHREARERKNSDTKKASEEEENGKEVKETDEGR